MREFMFIIRADGNAKTGAGHIMRCLTVGGAVRKLGGEVLVLCADENSAGLAESRGFRAGVLHTDYRQLEAELPVWDSWVQDDRNTILVDSYYVTAAYLEGLRRYGSVYLMDDLQSKAYPVDGVINYNLYADPAVYKKIYQKELKNDRDVNFYLGPDYVPLREQFHNVTYHVRDSVDNVLITTGGGDTDNIARDILDVIYRTDITYHVLVGRFSPHFESWQRLAEERPDIRIYFDVQDMAELMRRCDVAVSAGGSTLYELAAVGVPFICFAYAENQEALTEYLGHAGTAGYAGVWHRDIFATRERLGRIFARLCEDTALRRRYHDRERSLIDGRGAYRLAEAMEASI